MKKKILVLLAGLMLGSSMAMAATPAAPVFSVANGKMADGTLTTDGGSSYAADGLNIYTAYVAPGNSVKLVRSKDGGATWSGSRNIYTHPVDTEVGGNTLEKLSIAISGDSSNPTLKIVHVVWEVSNPNGLQDARDIYYSYADATNLDAWSAPLRINGSRLYLEAPAIVVTKSGGIFVKARSDNRQLFLMTATSYAAGFFTEPALIPVSATGPVAGDAEMFLDASNNLHLSYPYYANDENSLAGIKYAKLSADGSWSTATVANPTTSGSNHSGLAAYDSKNIYIASMQGGNLVVFNSINGGTSWTKKVLFTATATKRTGSYVDVTVNASKVISAGTHLIVTAADGTELSRNTIIYRSIDGGSTWSTATTIPGTGGGYIAMGVDGNGKLGVVTISDSVDGEAATYFSKEK